MTVDDILKSLPVLRQEFDRIVSNDSNDSKLLRYRYGIELYSKIGRALHELDRLEAEGGGYYLGTRGQLRELADRLLRDVFYITGCPLSMNPDKFYINPDKTEKPQMTKTNPTVETFANGDVAAATVSYNGVVVNASARRDPHDEPDPHTGELLATGRAFRKLANQMLTEANRRVAEADKQRRRKQAEAAAEKARNRKLDAQRRRRNQAVRDAEDLRRMLDEVTAERDSLKKKLASARKNK